ncbi:dihydroxyacid dehydratase [Trichoderma arundinaceum]|uniref:Dihydroxyacid dehydratase n=1 Tax=Trichoderma arundinaceum TaxID=490622 RepID=A0A395NZ66_TRIAR|nr:dihydroxyacid dehydratase [Trichoderma arundinaceum]
MASSSQDVATGPFDLLLLMDATSSMGTFVEALNKSLPEVISISALTGCFERIGVLAYRDYCDTRLTEWSGWCSPAGKVQGADVVSQDAVLDMARKMIPTGGGDWPEATKTGLAKAHSVMRSEATTIVLLYADAPPHFKETGDENYRKEKAALANPKLWGEDGKLFVDWTSAAKSLRNGPKKAVVFSMIQQVSVNAHSAYLYLSTVTGGTLFEVEHMVSDKISQLTIGVLLTWMRLGKTVADTKTVLGFLTKYKATSDILTPTNEDDDLMQKYIAKGHFSRTPAAMKCINNVESQSVTLGVVPSLVKARGPKVESFADKYANDPGYKNMAVCQLKLIIETNVSAISLNPIFGSLWRAVCNDRLNSARDELIQLFGLQVDRISDQNEKTRMKAWLAESYNYADEINDMIKAVAPEDCFPMLFLDPTADFGFVEDTEDEQRRLQDFTRPELLEIGRSCDYKILRRLGKVLTRLTFVNTKDELPHHIRTMDPKNAVPCVPFALAKKEYNREFWKVLLHAVLPGTKLGARPASLLAALALRMGIVPLRDAADQELLAFSGNWNSLDIPETWNLGCLNLLLDADRDYEKRIADGVTVRVSDESRILSTKDRDTFKALVDYKMLELNLDTALQARITWTPEKSKVALGPLVICKKCLFPRSVTVMASGGVCGLCDVESDGCSCSTCTMSEDHVERMKTNVSKDQTELSEAYWVECGQISCRAQYVVYNPNALCVRPKCYFCRHAGQSSKNAKEHIRRDVGAAPTVECSKCLSRIIWPDEYRPDDLDLNAYQCPACVAGRKTVVEEETTARKLSSENNWDWLLRNEEKTIKQPFNGRTVFYIASNCNLTDMDTKVEILPAANEDSFTIRGKLVRNPDEVKASLLNWVSSRRTESATCSLCFSSIRKGDVLPACGRSGCHQLICSSCRDSWYGINSPGRILNIPALHCPFCRRRPAPKAISKFRLHQIGLLRAAVEDAGSWIYAWCGKCGFAKQYVERVCAAGAPAELVDWTCEECKPDLVVGEKRIRRCPGCGIATEKTYGCDHITCPCGTHWCYACGKESDESDIYEHMEREHGGLDWGYETEEQ